MDYKEKLKLAKEALESGSYDKETIEYIFPELKDERIRKELKALVAWAKSYTACGITGEDAEMMLDWLEKATENSVCKVKIGQTYKCIASPRYTCFRKGNIYHVKDNFIAELINICSNCFVLFEKQGEQKPAEWSDEDETILEDICSKINRINIASVGVESKICKSEIAWLKSLRPQPKQGWSEWDGYLLDETIQHLEELIR